MAKKKKGLETTLANWAYENKKAGNKVAQVLKNVNEVKQVLGEKKK